MQTHAQQANLQTSALDSNEDTNMRASIFADDAADTLTSSQEEEHVLPLTETEAWSRTARLLRLTSVLVSWFDACDLV